MAISYFRHLFYPNVTQVFIFPLLQCRNAPSSKNCFSRALKALQHSFGSAVARLCTIIHSLPVFFSAFWKIQSYLLLFIDFVYIRSKKTLFCFLSHGPHKFRMRLRLWRRIYLLLLALSNMNFIYVLNNSILSLTSFMFYFLV